MPTTKNTYSINENKEENTLSEMWRSLFTNPKGFEANEDTNNNNIYIHGDGRNSIDMH